MDQTTLLSTIALIVSIGGTFLGILNHRRVISKCCGRSVDFSLDVNQTTPPPNPPILTQIPPLNTPTNPPS